MAEIAFASILILLGSRLQAVKTTSLTRGGIVTASYRPHHSILNNVEEDC